MKRYTLIISLVSITWFRREMIKWRLQKVQYSLRLMQPIKLNYATYNNITAWHWDKALFPLA